MIRFAQQGRRTTGNRAFGRRFGRSGAAAGALVLALPLTLSLAPQALAQSSGIFINNDVLNSLGPGPGAAPGAPLAQPAPAAPVAPSLLPVQPLAPQPQAGSSLNFQPYGSGNYVVTRPGTLLFPPLEAPTSTLAPGFTDNHAARAKAMDNAFAEGPEPSSQLLIPLQHDTGASDSVVVFMDNLPPADPEAQAGSAPVLTLQRPALATPAPAPRKPEVPVDMLAETGATAIDDTTAALAPEFRTPEPEVAVQAAPETRVPAVETAELPPAAAEETAVAAAPAAAPLPEPAEPAPAAVAASEPAANEPVSGAVAADAMPATVTTAPEESTSAPAEAVQSAEAKIEPVASSTAETAPVTTTEPAPSPAPHAASTAPVSLLPPRSDMAGTDGPLPSAEVPAPVTQTAALPRGGDTAAAADPGPEDAGASDASAVADMSFEFDSDSAELSIPVQNELRSLASTMRTGGEGRIQVLGFASADGGSDDLARRLALSRALKVRTFLIDAGVPSARIQVRSLGAQTDGGPANRVDIRPIDS